MLGHSNSMVTEHYLLRSEREWAGRRQAMRILDDVVDAIPETAGGRREDVLANAPAAEHGFFGVPKVIE